MEAFQQSADYWKPSTSLVSLSVDELILGGRLAARLGGNRLSRRLFRSAYEREPSNPTARYFATYITRGWGRLQDLREFESNRGAFPTDPPTQASWLAWYGVVWAHLRDFATAYQCLERARALDVKDGWVLSCESDVLGIEDKWKEAAEAAQRAWEMNPGAPFSARSFSNALLNLGRVNESARWLAAASEGSQSYEIVHLACWHHCALAETLEGSARTEALAAAQAFIDRLPALTPLADRESRAAMARSRLDIAQLADDHEAMERSAKETRIPFYRRVLENLHTHPGAPRTRLPFLRAVQKHQACLPTSLASALATHGLHFDPDAIAAEITFGGTAEWAAAEWLQQRGLVVRFFPVTAEIATALIQHGIGFILTLEGDDNAHAVAVVGLDEAAGTLLIHDPMAFRNSEYLLGSFTREVEPLGWRGMVAVPEEKASLLDQLLPLEDVAVAKAFHNHWKALVQQGPVAANEVVVELSKRFPSNPGTRFLQAAQALEDGRTGEALLGFQQLLRSFPNSVTVRVRLLAACRALGNTALMRDTLAGVVERGVLPGVQSQQDWVRPPARYVAEYADLLRQSAETLEHARSLLHGLIRHSPMSADAWHVLADLLWKERANDDALLAYRLAACQAVSNEHYALSYCDTLCMAHREEEGLASLEKRVQRFGSISRATATWITWISAFEQWGHPARSLAACREAIDRHGESDELLAFVVPFLARMGQWQEAEELLGRLKKTGNLPLFYQAAVDFHRLRGDLKQALDHAAAWVEQAPRYMRARYLQVELVAKLEGDRAAVELSRRWMLENPGHDEMEVLYYRQLDGPGGSKRQKYFLLLRRVRRNPEDGWAWRDVGFRGITDYEQGDDRHRARLEPRIAKLMEQCERTVPEEAPTWRLRGRWLEVRSQWREAVDAYLESIARDPGHLFGYQRAWDCSSAFPAEERRKVWERMEPLLLSCPGRISLARDTVKFLAQRFGVSAAERAVSHWKEVRPDDPEITEAFADLLLEHGQGRTDAARALAMLEPAVERYPHHVGLRSSLGEAYRRLGRFRDAENVLGEILRRHPADSQAILQLSWVRERSGKLDEARELLESASSKDPQNLHIHDARVQLLIRSNRFEQARQLIQEILRQAPEDVSWRERAIRHLLNCGDEAAAADAAREGVRVFPRGAYLWNLLGITLNQLRRFAAPGEIEMCFRRSVEFNADFFDGADRLALHLVEQQRHQEAIEAMQRILPRMGDPSPAKGRLAWIRRQQGKKREGRDELSEVVSAMPWYLWGWGLLLDWLVEDEAWDEARTVLATVPEELRTNTQFRRQRLEVLERANLPKEELDTQWDELLRDFPEETPLHLLRYDTLRSAKRLVGARAVLKAIPSYQTENPYYLARHIEVLTEENQPQEALEALQRVFFAEAEPSTWPVDYSWEAIKRAQLQEKAYLQLRQALEKGQRPTPRAFFVLSGFALERGGTRKVLPQPFWRARFPDRGARELLQLLAFVDRAPWADGRYRARVFERLSGAGYYRLVLKYWKEHQ